MCVCVCVVVFPIIAASSPPLYSAMSSQDTKKQILCMNRRRRPSAVVVLPPTTAQAEDTSCGNSTVSVTVSPMSTQDVKSPAFAGHSVLARASPFGDHSPQSPSVAPPAQRSSSDGDFLSNGACMRPSPIRTVSTRDDAMQDAGELLLSTPAGSVSVHRRPCAEVPRSSSVSDIASSPLGTTAQSTGKCHAKAEDVADVASLWPSVKTVVAPPPPPPPAAAAATTSGRTAAKKVTAPTMFAVSADSSGACGEVSPEFVCIDARQSSYQDLESPQETAFVSDLGISFEDVDWERVDADPRELFRLRNVMPEPVPTRQSTKSAETTLNDTQSTVAPDAASQPRVKTEAAAVPASAVVIGSGSPQEATPAPSRKQPATSCSNDACSLKGDRAQREGQHLVNERLEDGQGENGAARAPREGEMNIFVAVRIRPCKEACGVKTTSPSLNSSPASKDTNSCVRVDARRGFVDCSTAVPASVLTRSAASNSSGGGAAGTATVSGPDGTMTAGSAAAAEGDKSDMAAASGKRIRTLRFYFDHILDEHVTQRDVMEQIGERAVERVLAGYHGTVLCYGQSGSGKTYTVVGPNGGRLGKKALRWRSSVPAAAAAAAAAPDLATSLMSTQELSVSASSSSAFSKEHVRIASEVGLLPRMLRALFSKLEARRIDSDNEGKAAGFDLTGKSLASWTVTFSALELYNEELRDLLPEKLSKKRPKQPTMAAKRADAAEDEARENAQLVKSPVTFSKNEKGRGGSRSSSARAAREGSGTEMKSLPATSSSGAFPTYPGLFIPNSGAGKTSLNSNRCWNAEDLDVLNAVSSSDDDDEDDDDDDDDDDNNSENAKLRNHSSGLQTDSPDRTKHGQKLPAMLHNDGENAQEPDPSQPATNDLTAPIAAGCEEGRGRITVGQLTSVSPSPSRQNETAGDPAKKQVVVIGDAASNANNNRGGSSSGGNTRPNNTATASLRTRISRRLPNSDAAVASKSRSPSQRPYVKVSGGGGTSDGASAGGSSANRSGRRASAATNGFNRSSTSKSGGSQLVIRQGQPPASTFKSRSSTRVRGCYGATRDTEEPVYIEGLREHPIHDLHEGMRVMRKALRQRQMASTELNSDSSRAHTFFFVKVEQRHWRRHNGKHANENEKDVKAKDSSTGKLVLDILRSTLTLVDLAGSERVSHTGAHGLRLKEAQNINLSLSALGNVMRLLSAMTPPTPRPSSSGTAAATTTTAAATVSADAHIPFRDSKLTRILQSSLGGNAITFLLCNLSPDYRDASETMSTLRFAKLSKTVKNKAKLNESAALVDDEASNDNAKVSAALVEKYKREQRTALEAMLAAESKTRQLAGDAWQMRNQMQQMAAYAWWLEEQLGYFASNSSSGGAGAARLPNNGSIIHDGLDTRAGCQTVIAFPTSLTGAESGAPSTVVGNSSSVGPLSDTERVTGRGSSSSAAAAGKAAEEEEEEGQAGGEKLVDNASWWRPSPPSPASIAPAAATTTTVRSASEGDGRKSGGADRKTESLISPVSPAGVSGSGAGAAAYWQNPLVRAFSSSAYPLRERQREMQQRLIAAASAVGLPYASTSTSVSASAAAAPAPAAPATFTYSPPPVSMPSNLRVSEEQQQQQSQPPPSPEQQSLSRVAVALAEERRARETAQARLAEVEQQNLLLRLRLSSLALQQREQENDRKSTHIAAPPAWAVKKDEEPSVVVSPSTDAASSLLTPSSPFLASFMWPPNYGRESSDVSLEAFLARCGFVPLKTSTNNAASVSSFLPATQTITAVGAAQQEQQPFDNPLSSSGLSSPIEGHSPRSVTANPSLLLGVRDGSAPREDYSSWNDTLRGIDDAQEHSLVSNASRSSAAATDAMSASSVQAVSSPTKSAQNVGHLLSSTPCHPSENSRLMNSNSPHNGRVRTYQRPRAMEVNSPESSPRARSPGWGQQLLNSVHTTLKAVGALSSHETSDEPDDLHSPVN